jgi:hypothetical protein
VVKHTGDGLMAAFPSVAGALESAVQIQRRFAGEDEVGFRLRIRIGMSAGEPVTEHNDFFGAAVQVAARLVDRAESGTVLVSSAVRDLALGKGFVFRKRGSLRPKGFAEPVQLFEVVAGTDVGTKQIGGCTNQVPVTQEFARRVHEAATGPGGLVLAEFFAERPYMTDGTYFLWDPLAAAMAADYPLGAFSPARIDVEEAEGPEVGFTRPVEGTPNVEYLSSADRAAAEDALLETLD